MGANDRRNLYKEINKTLKEVTLSSYKKYKKIFMKQKSSLEILSQLKVKERE